MVEHLLVDEALRLAEGNRTAAARMLGVHRKVVARAAPSEKDVRAPDPDEDTLDSVT